LTGLLVIFDLLHTRGARHAVTALLIHPNLGRIVFAVECRRKE